jgi:hypothetical protein
MGILAAVSYTVKNAPCITFLGMRTRFPAKSLVISQEMPTDQQQQIYHFSVGFLLSEEFFVIPRLFF